MVINLQEVWSWTITSTRQNKWVDLCVSSLQNRLVSAEKVCLGLNHWDRWDVFRKCCRQTFCQLDGRASFRELVGVKTAGSWPNTGSVSLLAFLHELCCKAAEKIPKDISPKAEPPPPAPPPPNSLFHSVHWTINSSDTSKRRNLTPCVWTCKWLWCHPSF